MGLPDLGLRLCILMALSMYVGNAMKDLVCGPRPIGLVHRDSTIRFLGKGHEEAEQNAKEYGLPSSHVMNSVCFNFFTVHYLLENDVVGPETAAGLYAAVVVWALWIAASRLYLGLHSPIDILTGAIAGLTIVGCFIHVEDEVVASILSGPHTLPCTLLVSLVALRLHPRPLEYTPSYEFTASFLGASSGVVAGSARTWPAHHAPGILLSRVAAAGAPAAARRVALGLAMVAAAKAAARVACAMLLPLLYRFFPTTLRALWQPPVADMCAPGAKRDPRLAALPHTAAGVPWDVEITARYFSYFALGWAVTEAMPRTVYAYGW
ncbi:Dihydrosphingosine 1-phosphate phosphatase YSR3 [Auxenochlorella protothecoides]|nr:Dihydrosphingosine 1-phosphate phosphatase YSR3 [Auxenochlorella protothecoides]KFM24438.1 Dihydrosphingosine 1-phosphate phosphatase YSR3 [Auxenochlorella protothecoides]RMZ54469.1 hypothetical protein APUTEX25_002045 [Auxenochlorella protothecoides]|eukprot:RMZ54469.1 hypothetical protein APUTEX25_002045 [Auxenochlorella protothecoides]